MLRLIYPLHYSEVYHVYSVNEPSVVCHNNNNNNNFLKNNNFKL